MRIEFKGTTNNSHVMINTLKVRLETGSIITVDRKETEWSFNEETGELDMTWHDCYLWAIDDCNIFGDHGYELQDEDSIREFAKLIDGGKPEFEIEDDADEDYWIKIDNINLCN